MNFLGGIFKRPAKDSKPKGDGKPKSVRSKKGAPPEPGGLTLDQKLDIVGIGLILTGVLIGFALLSPTHSDGIAAFLRGLGQLFGLGRYLVPVGITGTGVWIVLRHFGDNLPRIAPERLMGWGILYIVALITLHFFVAQNVPDAYAKAAAEQGGGYVGAVALDLLINLIGQLGAVVVVVAFWIIGLILALGITTQHMMQAVQFFTDRGIGQSTGTEQTSQPELPFRNPPPTRAAMPPAARPEPEPAPAPTVTRAEPVPKKSRTAEAKAAQAAAQAAQQVATQPVASLPPAPIYDQPIVIGGGPIWERPEIAEMLEAGTESSTDDEYDRKRAHVIEDTLNSFGAPVKVVEINRGPTITQFGVEPDYVEVRGKKTKVKVGKISSLSDDLALALAAPSIRIEAPVPGKGYVGIEVPNTQAAVVTLRDVMESESFRKVKTSLGLALGQDVSGQAVCADLTKMPHILIAGTTGSGKSVCVNSIIAALLINNTPDDLRLIMVDPKRVELTSYNGIPHLLTPVVVDLERVVNSLQWVTREMDERYRKFAKNGVRNIEDYNSRVGKGVEKKLPYLVVFIDELADLMMLAPDETEKTITRLAQMARATGIHLVIATQRPSVDVVTGLIKANFPARIAFAVASSIDSRVILDQPGAEKLLGRGDMLFQSPDAPQPVRMQGVYVSDAEIHRVVAYWRGARGLDENGNTNAATAPAAAPGTAQVATGTTGTPGAPATQQDPLWAEMRQAEVKAESDDDLFDESVKVVREMRRASITLLQRRLRIGYGRAARLIDLLEEKGIVGPAKSGAQQREVIGFSNMEDMAPTNAPSERTSKPTRTWEADE